MVTPNDPDARAPRGDSPVSGQPDSRPPPFAEPSATAHPTPDTEQPTGELATSPDETRRIGPYHLLQSLGKGGMGEVWLAEQRQPIHRHVAVKIIKQGMDTREIMARFETERQALALMDHPNIAKVYDAGSTPQGQPYFAMEYIPGITITEYCDLHRLDTQERLALMEQVCAGVQHAHQKAVIHRDLKPGNILVTEIDGKPVPKIIDFGVAKATAQRLTEKTLFTQFGALIGTPSYMSPEQAEHTGEDVDTRTDVYSLGVILYELLAGALPFDPTQLRQAGYEGIRRLIRQQDPPKPSMRISTLGERRTEIAARRRTEPRRLLRQLRGDLDWITMRALEKDRNRRYGSPDDLADDIRRHLRQEPVLAGPPVISYRVTKFIRRHRVGVLIAASGVVTLLAFAVTMTVQAHRIARERDRAMANELTSLGRIPLENDPTSAVAFALASLEVRDQPAARELIGQALACGPLRRELPSIDARNPISVAVSPDGNLAATGWTRKGAIGIYPLNGGKPRALYTDARMIPDVEFSRDGRFLLTAGSDSTLTVWQVSDLQKIHAEKLPGSFVLVSLDDPCRVIACTTVPREPHRWFEVLLPEAEVRPLGTSPLPPAEVELQPGIDPTGRWTAVCRGREIVLLELDSIEKGAVRTVGRGDADIVSLEFDATGMLLVSGDIVGGIKVWDVQADPPVLMRAVAHGERRWTYTHFDPRAPRFVSFQFLGGLARIWDLRLPSFMKPIDLHDRTHWVHDAAFAPDGSVLSCRNGFGLAHWPKPDDGVREIEAGRAIPCLGGDALVEQRANGDFVVYPLTEGGQAAPRVVAHLPPQAACYTDRSGRHVIAYTDEVADIDLVTGAVRFEGPVADNSGGAVWAIRISPSGRHVATIQKHIRVLERDTGEQFDLIRRPDSEFQESDWDFVFAGEDSILEFDRGDLFLWDLRDRSHRKLWSTEWTVDFLFRDGRAVLARDATGCSYWIDPWSGRTVRLGTNLPPGGVRADHHLGLGLVALGGIRSRTVELFSLSSGERWMIGVPGEGDGGTWVLFDPQGRWLWASISGGAARYVPLPIAGVDVRGELSELRAELGRLTNLRVKRWEGAWEGWRVLAKEE